MFRPWLLYPSRPSPYNECGNTEQRYIEDCVQQDKDSCGGFHIHLSRFRLGSLAPILARYCYRRQSKSSGGEKVLLSLLPAQSRRLQ